MSTEDSSSEAEVKREKRRKKGISVKEPIAWLCTICGDLGVVDAGVDSWGLRGFDKPLRKRQDEFTHSSLS